MTGPRASFITSQNPPSFRWDTSTTIPSSRIRRTARQPSRDRPFCGSPLTPVARRFSSFQVSIPMRAPKS